MVGFSGLETGREIRGAGYIKVVGTSRGGKVTQGNRKAENNHSEPQHSRLTSQGQPSRGPRG